MKTFTLKNTDIKVVVSDHFKNYFLLKYDYFCDNKDYTVTVNEKLGEGFAFTLTAPVNGDGEYYVSTTLRSGKQWLTSKAHIAKNEAQQIIDSLKADNSEPLKKLLINNLWMPVSTSVLAKPTPKPKRKHKALPGQLDMFEVM